MIEPRPTMIVRTVSGHDTFKDIIILTICICVKIVLFNVECVAFLLPDDFIFKTINITNKKIPTKNIIIKNAILLPFMSGHC